jgi:hypothetical protein
MARNKLLTPTLTSLRRDVREGMALREVDHRSAWSKRLNALIAAHTSDLGGDDELSEAERVLVRRAAMLTLQLELIEFNWATSHEGAATAKTLAEYQRCTNTLRRTLEALGLRRRPRDVTPDLKSYIEGRSRLADDLAEELELEGELATP